MNQVDTPIIPQINNAAEATKSENDIQSHLNDARALLDADPDYISDEKDDIANAVYQKLNDAYHARLLQIGIATPATQATAAPGQTGSGIISTLDPIVVNDPNGPRNNLLVIDPQQLQFHSEMLNSIQKEYGNRMEGTAAGAVGPH